MSGGEQTGKRLAGGGGAWRLVSEVQGCLCAAALTLKGLCPQRRGSTSRRLAPHLRVRIRTKVRHKVRRLLAPVFAGVLWAEHGHRTAIPDERWLDLAALRIGWWSPRIQELALATHELVVLGTRRDGRRSASAPLVLHNALARELLRLVALLVEDVRPQHVACHGFVLVFCLFERYAAKEIDLVVARLSRGSAQHLNRPDSTASATRQRRGLCCCVPSGQRAEALCTNRLSARRSAARSAPRPPSGRSQTAWRVRAVARPRKVASSCGALAWPWEKRLSFHSSEQQNGVKENLATLARLTVLTGDDHRTCQPLLGSNRRAS